MSRRDASSDSNKIHGLSAQVLTGDANSASANLADYHGCEALVNVGASGDTLSGSVYIELKLQESDDDAAWSDCADADISDPVTSTTGDTGVFAVIDDPAEDEVSPSCAYLGNKQYVRCVVNLVGTHSVGTPIGVILRRTHAEAVQ